MDRCRDNGGRRHPAQRMSAATKGGPMSLISFIPVIGPILDALIGGGGLAPQLEKAFEAKLNAKSTEDRIAADVTIQSLQTQQTILINAMGHKMFWIGWACFVIPLGLWWAAVLINTIFAATGSWGIGTVPNQLIPWANIVFNAVFYSGGGVASVGLVAGAASKILGRK